MHISRLLLLLQPGKEEDEAEEEEEVVEGPMPLGQLITAFSRAATTEATENLLGDILYISYANIMSQVSEIFAILLGVAVEIIRQGSNWENWAQFNIAENGMRLLHAAGQCQDR